MKRQRGLTLVLALFLLVVLSLLGGFMAKMIGVQTATVNASLQGAKAHLAAKAGIEWSAAYIAAGGNCVGVNQQTPMAFPGLTGFVVSLTCSSTGFNEAGVNETVYTVSATGQFSSYSNSQYVSRTIKASIIN